MNKFSLTSCALLVVVSMVSIVEAHNIQGTKKKPGNEMPMPTPPGDY